MALLLDLRTYVANKGNSVEDAMKKSFFNDIIQLLENDKLSVAALTEKLASLTDKELISLFWWARKKDRSANSQAARWIAKLYEHLGVSKEDFSLENIVTKGISEEDKKKLAGSLYRQWQSHPTSSVERQHLEHEFKELLGINYPNLSLAQSLIKFYENDKALPHLDDKLILLWGKAPEFFSFLLHELCSYLLLQDTENNKTLEFIQIILDIVHDKQELLDNVIYSHPLLAAALVKENPEKFFSLPVSLQRQIQPFIGEDTLQEIKESINQTPLFLHQQAEQKTVLFSLLQAPDQRANALNEDAESSTSYRHLETTIYDHLKDREEVLIAFHQADPALKAIKKYLAEKPNAYKSNFFSNLMDDINRNGLTVQILNKHMQRVNKDALFAKWSGKHNSRAAGLIFELYKRANLTNNDEDIEFIKNNLLKSHEDALYALYDLKQEHEKEKFFEHHIQPGLKEKVSQVLQHPEQATQSLVGRQIEKTIHHYQSMVQFSQRDLAKKQKTAEAVYQNYLVTKALEIAQRTEAKKLIFDPQGHVILALTLNDANYAEIYRLITGREGTKDDLTSLLGSEVTPVTWCNIDIEKVPNLKDKFKARMDSTRGMDVLLDNFFASSRRSSVIALQEELMMHVSLSLRALEKNAKVALLTEDARLELMQAINTMTLDEFASVLKASATGTTIDYVGLNKKLDKARVELAKRSRELLVDKIMEGRDHQSIANLSVLLTKGLNKHSFTSTTATGWDYLRTDADNESSILISATNETAHDKQYGHDKVAIRVITRCHYDPVRQTVTAHDNPTIEARIPSMAIKSGSHKKAVEDVRDKLGYVHRLLTAKNQTYQGPVIYNLLTSLHTKAYDNSFFESANKQRASAARILKGSHLYNLAQLESGKMNALVYVQNIPVNQHTNELSYGASDGATREAAVMTDLALLATLSYHSASFSPMLRDSVTSAYRTAHASYLSFLPQARDGDHYFKDSQQGKETMEFLTAQKALWKGTGSIAPAADLQSLAVQTLFKMMANDEHQRKQFGMLAQALSVFIEPVSIAGCKSANEREQAVAGRVGLLRSIDSASPTRLPADKKAVIEALTDYVSGNATLAAVQEKLDIAYNKYNLQGAVAAVSMEDQGGPSKVQATDNEDDPGVISELNTNYAETGYLDCLSQQHSSVMQAHNKETNLPETFTQLITAKAAPQVSFGAR
ncbi:hypothetical protein [Legionella jamestowniensis]|uniref:Uncharacterized protein n=1 Tax=Legionella jamestowniensis TaxID=455 RepID=A0A0W0UI03_9GAMM|nr:hypothetical protein [Legionella jamestowniensis]KTD07356.1 hypothetical protein Ljam_1551 [Legionella jamestowniensis]SFL94157.1 hypothetical protein SAMN02746073_2660 [Legionella jamestowniensis DSM 19215]